VSGAAPLRAHAPALRNGRALPPRDAAVPALPALLDAEAMAGVLERSLRPGARVDDVRVSTVDYRPGTGATIAYAVDVDGRRHVAVAAAGSPGGAEAARVPARVAIARTLGGAAPVARPLTYDAGLGALVHWYPLDLAMPVLAKPRAELVRLVARAGVPAEPTAGDAETLLYRPGQRAVLRLGRVVLKAYADDAAFRAGVEGLRVAAGLGLPGGPRLHGAFAELRLTVQPALAGTPVPRTRAHEVAPTAGAMLRVLHDAAVPGLPVAGPERLLTAAAASAALVGAVAPGLGRRAFDLLARLEEHLPAPAGLVPCHGDFNVSQFLELDGALAVLDFDEACLAAPALDVAAYAANSVGGREGDLDRARAALDALLEGYGPRPEALGWHLAATLLRRAPSPFRLHKRRWPQRMQRILGAAEEALRS
jgi:aminoglycoside phosphotransferase (APT) family kinase protein